MRKIYSVILVSVVLLFLVMIGPMDCFSHGFYCDEIEYEEVIENGICGYVDLEDSSYEVKFSPQRNHFAGYGIILSNQPEGNSGKLVFTLNDNKNKMVEMLETDLADVNENEWYYLYASVPLKMGETYTLHISAENCSTYPALILVDDDYLGSENIEGNLLISYAYAESTFTFAQKIILGIFVVALTIFLLGMLNKQYKYMKFMLATAFFICLTGLLAWNYMFNSMDKSNDTFNDFSSGSEALVTGILEGNYRGIHWDFENGLGRYTDSSGIWNSYEHEFLTFEETWIRGYSKVLPEIVVDSNNYTHSVAQIGNYVMFPNGDILEITDIRDDGTNYILCLNTDQILTERKYGDLHEVRYMDKEGNILPMGIIGGYGGQLGLQGKIFQHIAYRMDYLTVIEKLHLLCSLASATVFTGIVFMLYKKYNLLMSVCFYVTFWLSPWVINFARNLYWVEFTWFIPMAVGLFCAIKINNRRCRLVSYILACVSILIKSLCGYEFISVIMLSLIAFLLIDFVLAVLNHDTLKMRLYFKTIFIIGVAAILGFIIALLLHAGMIGEGNLIDGLRYIYENEVLRRTQGADYNVFGAAYWESFNVSIMQVLSIYFHFNTNIITGISGSLFGIICMIPFGIWGVKFCKYHVIEKEEIILYIVFGVTCISWYILGKAHAYNHQHFCYVLWYFGFIQSCFYIAMKNAVWFICEHGRSV